MDYVLDFVVVNEEAADKFPLSTYSIHSGDIANNFSDSLANSYFLFAAQPCPSRTLIYLTQ